VLGCGALAAALGVSLASPGGSLQFVITDDGDGFGTSRTRPGPGLQGMANRLAALGGTFRLDSMPGRGDHRNRAAAGTCSGQLAATAACQEILVSGSV
jgi:glucose-6-phosphate-specific signal transduction histidine kinase